MIVRVATVADYDLVLPLFLGLRELSRAGHPPQTDDFTSVLDASRDYLHEVSGLSLTPSPCWQYRRSETSRATLSRPCESQTRLPAPAQSAPEPLTSCSSPRRIEEVARGNA